jgi:flagellar motility protein MotE (MotC chaperone)
MKAKIILSLAVLNGAVIALFFFIGPGPASAGGGSPAKAAPQPAGREQVIQDLGFNAEDRMEILRRREQRLDAREAELKELEGRVQERIRQLEEIHSVIRNDLAAYRVVSGERIKQLVKIYSSMKPNAAAALMNNIETDVAVEVFLGLKGEVAGGILSYMDPAKAALITQRLVSYRGGGSAGAAAQAQAEAK